VINGGSIVGNVVVTGVRGPLKRLRVSVKTVSFKDLKLTMPSDSYKRLLKRYKATGIVWAFVDLVRFIPVLLFPVLLFQRPPCRPVFATIAFPFARPDDVRR